jgi:hypothetical protein
MKKLVILVFILSSVKVTAQNKKITLSAGGGVYVGYSYGTSTGPGFEIKAGRNLTENSQLTLSAGFLKLRTTTKNLNNDYTHTRLVPFMIGILTSMKMGCGLFMYFQVFGCFHLDIWFLSLGFFQNF